MNSNDSTKNKRRYTPEEKQSVLDFIAERKTQNKRGAQKEAAERFGRQCVVLSIDGKRNDKGSWDVYVEGGRKNTGIDVLEWAKKGEALGAGEICMNSMDADGEKNGYDLELLKALSEILTIPVIASGGAGTMEDFKKAFEAGADAALAASVFHFGEIPIPDLKKYLAKEGIPIRPAE